MNSSTSAPSRENLFARLAHVSLIDERRFRRRLHKARAPQALRAIAEDIATASQKVSAIDAQVPSLSYPEQLPVSARREDIAQAIKENQVVVIAGETGSGKTTQIPKICLELGRGRRGLIGHTQPRRIAARTVAERIAEELGQEIGQSVGYAIRFDDRVSDTSAIKLMTDGILLAEMQRDRYLNAYDTIIIDEAHERSLNIDFLLGYLKRLLPLRPDLKVIITSATIDPESFARHFSGSDGKPAPIIEVSGRTYPVEIRYRPLKEEINGRLVDQDPLDALLKAIEELMAEGSGDILCFFPGEADIRDAKEVIEGKKYRNVHVIPLFGRLSNEEQHRVFKPHSGRRIVLATNIAETSLTVPGIHYVIDTGTARISRYSTRTKVQRLPIEPISQASANQRSGRSGRVADGIAIRLYSEEDFESRPEFTDPEILRTNLASVILQMISLRLGDIESFPFVQSPEHKAIRDGLSLLEELGALKPQGKDQQHDLTPIGRDLARIPVDPRMARMMVEAQRLGTLPDVMVIVAAMTIQDVRERPLEFQAQADQAHARFKDKTSDFLGMLKIWDYIAETRDELSGNQFRKRMKNEYLHYMRIREWRDLVRQLNEVSQQLGWKVASPKSDPQRRDVEGIHRAILSGLLSQIGAREELDKRDKSRNKEFRGARGTTFMIFPGSALAKNPPEFVMAGQLVETTRLWARDVAGIEASWVEEAAGHLLKYSYSEPIWSRKRGAAMAHQKVMLYGVTIVADRLVPYHRVDPQMARDMFIRHALIEGDWDSHHDFHQRNIERLADAEEFEEKARRRGLVVDEDTLFGFYDARLPKTITTARNFDRWWKRTSQHNQHLLDFDPVALLSEDAAEITAEAFPDTWRDGSLTFDLSYLFEPGNPRDGVTVHIPIPVLAGVNTQGYDWLVPGLREELVTELIRTLPKPLRRSVVPAPDFAARVLPGLEPFASPLVEQVANQLQNLGGTGINASDFRPERLPPHLRITFGALDRHGKIIDADKDLARLQQRQAQAVRASISARARQHEASEVSTWTADNLGTIPAEVSHSVDGQSVTSYPALAATAKGVEMKVLPTKEAADASMMTATLTMLLRSVSINAKQMLKGLPLQQRVAVDHYPHGGPEGLVDDARLAALRDLIQEAGGPVRDPQEFEALRAKIAPEVPGRVRRAVVALAPSLVAFQRVEEEVNQWEGPAIDDIRAQMAFMLPKNAITMHGMGHLQHLGRYVEAIAIRLEDMGIDPDRDADRQDIIDALKSRLRSTLKSLPESAQNSRAVREIGWMIAELRVSLFAQRLGTARPISAQRIEKALDQLH